MKATQVALQQDNLGLARELLGRYMPQKGEEDLRGLEWRYLWQESRGDELQTIPHPAGVLCAELSPDGHCLLTVSGDRRTNLSRIFNVSTSREIAHFATAIPAYSAKPFAFSPQGNWLASQGLEGLEIRNTDDWKVLRILKAGAPCCFSEDGKYLVASSTNANRAATDNLYVWNVADWTCRVLTNTTGYAHLVIRPGETQTLCAAGLSQDGAQVDLWNLETGTKTALLPSPAGYPTALGISPDGKWLAVGQFDGFVLLWDLTTRQLALRFQAHPGEAFGVAFSADGQILASGGMDQVIRLWKTGTTNQIGAPLKGHLHVVNSLAFSKDGQKLVSTSQDGTAKMWDPKPKPMKGKLIKLPETAAVQRVLPDHQAVLTLDYTEEVSQVWNLSDGRLLHSLSWSNWSSFNAGRKEGLHYMAEEQLLVTVATNGTVDFRDLATGAHLRSLSLGESSFNPFCLSPDGRWAFCAEGALWDLNAAKRVHQFSGFEWPSARAFSSDSRFLAFVNTNGLVSIWDLRTMQEKRSLQTTTGGLALQFSPDGKLLAFGDMEGLVWLWSVETGKLLHPPLKGHQERVGPVAFSPDGKTLLSASPFDPSVRWWHVATGQEMLMSRDLRLPASHLSYRTDFNPGGKFLLFQRRQGPIQITELLTFAEIDAIEER
jgi:WD40 repeat protein